MRSKTIAIIGAGIVGVSTAVWLQRDGHDVILIDKAGPGEGTSHGNGGVLGILLDHSSHGSGAFAAKGTSRMLFDPSQPLVLEMGIRAQAVAMATALSETCQRSATLNALLLR